MTTPNDQGGRRPSRTAKGNLGLCVCGSDWFLLIGGSSATQALPDGGVNIRPDGSIQSYSGEVVCARCKTPYVPPRERLRRV